MSVKALIEVPGSFVQTVLEQGGHFAGINRKVQLKPTHWTGEDENKRFTEAILILKHGGVLTHAGRQQVYKFSHAALVIFWLLEGNVGIIRFP